MPMKHTSKTTRKGDWVVYSCNECDFELWDNLKTGDTKIFNANPYANHSGSYVSPEYELEITSSNRDG